MNALSRFLKIIVFVSLVSACTSIPQEDAVVNKSQKPVTVVSLQDKGTLEKCHRYHIIEFRGAPLLDASQRDRIALPYLSRCVSNDELRGLTGAVDQYYLSQKHFDMHSVIPPQDLSTGVLVVMIEGNVLRASPVPDAGKSLIAKPKSYGRVLTCQTLWQVAKEQRPWEHGASMAQMMTAIRRANPDAFVQGTAMLREGVELMIPPADEVNKVDARKAAREMKHTSSVRATEECL